MEKILLLLFIVYMLISLFRNKEPLFIPLIISLFVAQLFIVKPGTDISLASYGNFQTYSLRGLSLSTIISIIIALYCIIKSFLSSKLIIKKVDLLILLFLMIVDVFGILNGNNAIFERLDMCAKINMPFFIYFYLRYNHIEKKQLIKMFLIINAILVIQVPICKLLYGKFSATTFYTYIMTEEFYGYYSSPHAFCAILGFLTIVNLKNINDNEYKAISILFLITNVGLIALSGVRTYLLASLISIAFIFSKSFIKKGMENTKKIAILTIIICLISGGLIIEEFSDTRLNFNYNTVETSSGRLNRWKKDINYFSNQSNLYNILLGNGYKSTYIINEKLVGISINSLNFIIDLLIENGIIGLMIITSVYIMIIKNFYNKKSKEFITASLIYMFIGLIINNLLPYITVTTSFVIFLYILSKEEKNENISTLSTSVS